MKRFGFLICVAGTIAAIVYPPYSMMGQRGWGFIGGNIVEAFGRGLPVRDHLDIQLLLLELLVINIVGVALMLAGRR
ncbi:MAG TPA: hypothetical protein VNI58_07355 [Mariprofundaceae bacterium]|nr:hypothetical protein [Mariprofundaceae bacterium]